MIISKNNLKFEIFNLPTKFNNKIRKAQQMKIPLMIIIGDKEVENNLLTIRLRSGKNLNDVKIESLINLFKENSKINDDESLKTVLEET